MQLRPRPEPKLVHVIRHGQAEHNVDDEALKKRNTELTLLGQQQAAGLRDQVKELSPEVVLTSPILRALQTTLGFLEPGTPTVVVPDARERVSHQEHLCELPISPAAASTSGAAYAAFDWRLVEASLGAFGSVEEWEQSMMDADLARNGQIAARAARLTSWIESRPEQCIALVSHGAFLMRLTADSYMNNCELRSYKVAGGKWRREDRFSVTNKILRNLPH